MEFFDNLLHDASKLGLDIARDKYLPSKEETKTVTPTAVKAYEQNKQPIVVQSSPIDSKLLMYGAGGLAVVAVIVVLAKVK